MSVGRSGLRTDWTAQVGADALTAAVLVGFFLFGLALTFGLPLLIALPVFIALPLGILQIWQMRRIADGARPNWNAVKVTSAALFFMSAYLLLFGFWTR